MMERWQQISYSESRLRRCYQGVKSLAMMNTVLEFLGGGQQQHQIPGRATNEVRNGTHVRSAATTARSVAEGSGIASPRIASASKRDVFELAMSRAPSR